VSAPVSGAGSGVAGVAGVDVSGHQASVNWAALARRGSAFAYVKATEGTTYRNPRFAAQRRGARAAGLLTGSYHYARPTASTGAAQARYFVANGGARAADGRTLPGALDLEKAAQGDPCYGRTPEQLVAWIRDFTVTYRDLTGRQAVIYVTAEWWDRCTGAEPSFASTNPLWLYDHDGSMGPFPSGWRSPLLWQHAVRDGLDRNVFRGSAADLQLWASRPRE
jgi:lysozyme